jgi:hypothetical protein
MVEITLLELNLDAEDLIANAPFSSGGPGEDESDDDADAGDDGGLLPLSDDESGDEDQAVGGDGDPPLKPLAVGAGLLLLVLAVVAGRRLLGGEPEPLP